MEPSFFQSVKDGFGSSKVRMVVKWESEGEFTLGSFWYDSYTMEVIDSKVNFSSLSYFTTIPTLDDINPSKTKTKSTIMEIGACLLSLSLPHGFSAAIVKRSICGPRISNRSSNWSISSSIPILTSPWILSSLTSLFTAPMLPPSSPTLPLVTLCLLRCPQSQCWPPPNHPDWPCTLQQSR